MADNDPSQGPFWQENCAYFQQHDPAFLAEVQAINAGGDLAIKQLPNGLPVAYWQDHWIDPPEAPQNQALQIVGAQQQPVHIHLGLGLGYFLEVDQAGPDTTIVVFEPQPEIAAAAMGWRPLAKICQRKDVYITCNFQQLEKLLLTHLTFGKGVKVVVSPGHERLFPEQFKYFQEVFNKVHEIRRLAKGMLGEAVTGTWAATFKALPYTTQLPGVDRLRNHFAGKPAILLSAGPSLEPQLPLLRAIQDRIILIAISRTAKILQRYGITPDFLVHTESQDYFHLIASCSNLADTHFLLADQSQSHYYRFPHGASMVYHSSQNPVTQWVVAQQPELRKIEALNSGSVSSVAFHLAVEMGCNPIMLAGQDLAFQDDQLYVDGGTATDIYQARRLRKVPGVFGKTLQTSNSYLVTLYWYEKIIPQLRKRFPDLKLYNATESGAKLPFFEHRSLRHLAHLYCQSSLDKSIELSATQEQVAVLDPGQLEVLVRQLETDLVFIAKHGKQYEAFEQAFLKKLGKAKKPKDFQNLQKQTKKLDAINNSLFVFFDQRPGVPGFFQAQIEQFRKIQQAIQQHSKGPQNGANWVRYMKANLKDLSIFHRQVQSQARYIQSLIENAKSQMLVNDALEQVG